MKKALSLLLAAIMVFGSAAGLGTIDLGDFSIKAEAAKVSGVIRNTEIGYTFDDATGELMLYGKGAMPDWELTQNIPWASIKKDIKKITFRNEEKDKITHIGESAFSGTSITSISIPSTVTSIGNYAFMSCPLTNLTIPDSVKTIGQQAFSGCGKLQTVTFGKGLTEIGDFAFQCSLGYTSLHTINFSKDGKLKTIGNHAFSGNLALKSLTIPDTVETIGDYAFSSCTNLKNATIGNGVTTIGAYAFCDCTSLKSVTFSENSKLATIGNRAFLVCSDLQKIAIPDSVVTIGDGAFKRCNALSEVTFGENSELTSLGYDAFYECVKLAKINLPAKLTTIGKTAFFDCDALTSITIPDSVTTIESMAFNGCNSLTAVLFGKNSKLTSINERTFSACNNLKTIVIPDSVNFIDKNAFSGCSALKDVTIGSGVTSIGNSAFIGLSSLKTITIPDNVESIGDNAFNNCSKLETVTLGKGVTHIGKDAFAKCGALKNINVSEENTMYSSDGGVLFSEDKTELLMYPAGKKELYYVIPEGVTDIEDYAFLNCETFISVYIPESVTDIGDYAFDGCEDIDHVCYGGTKEQWALISINPGNDAITYDGEYGVTIHYGYDPETHVHEHIEELTKKPTCTEKGQLTLTCFCGNKATEDVPAKGHTEGDWVTEEYPTCTEEGKKSKYCKVCKTHLKSEAIPATGHKEGYTDYESMPTCTEDGKGVVYCTYCGEMLKEDVIPATGHTAGEWEVIEKPSTEAEGKKVKNCTVCGEKVEEAVIAKVVFDDALITPPAETTVKYLEYITVSMDESKIPEGGYVIWDADNLNCIVYQEGNDCVVYGYSNGDTTLYATVYDAEGNAILTDTQVVTANVNFIQKIIMFFKILFGLAQALPLSKSY